MIVYGKIYEDRFAFWGSQPNNQILIGDNKKEITFRELVKKHIIVFMPEILIREFEKFVNEGSVKAKIHHGSLGRILGIEFETLMFRNFNALCGYAKFEDLKESFEWDTDNEAELMRHYIHFLHDKEKGIGLQNPLIAMGAKSFIAECGIYKGLSGAMFYISNNAMPKSSEERRFVFNYYKNKLMEKSGKIYGILEHKPGYYQNVLRIDLHNFYGYLQCVEKFLSNNPYQVLTGRIEAKFDYLPQSYRNKIIYNYKIANQKDIYSKGVRQFFKDMNNLTPGRSENLEIYLKRTTTKTAGFLQPQHGFEIVSKGIDYLESYTQIFKQFGAVIVARDTDSIKLTGLTEEQGRRIVNYINKKVVESLIAAGFSEDDANCGIGQFKVEGYSKEYYQFADKAYCFTTDKGIEITFAGMGKKEKEELLKTNPTFNEIVEKLKSRHTQVIMPIEVNNKWVINFTGGVNNVK